LAGSCRLNASNKEINVRAIVELLGKLYEFARHSLLGKVLAGLLALLVGYLVFEAFVLMGPRIYDGQVIYDKPFSIMVQEGGHRYVCTVGRMSEASKRYLRRRLSYTVTGPGGAVIAAGQDPYLRAVRRFQFTPPAPGVYTVLVHPLQGTQMKNYNWFTVNYDDDTHLLRRFSHLWPLELGVYSPFFPDNQIPGHVIDFKRMSQGLPQE